MFVINQSSTIDLKAFTSVAFTTSLGNLFQIKATIFVKKLCLAGQFLTISRSMTRLLVRRFYLILPIDEMGAYLNRLKSLHFRACMMKYHIFQSWLINLRNSVSSSIYRFKIFEFMIRFLFKNINQIKNMTNILMK